MQPESCCFIKYRFITQQTAIRLSHYQRSFTNLPSRLTNSLSKNIVCYRNRIFVLRVIVVYSSLLNCSSIFFSKLDIGISVPSIKTGKAAQISNECDGYQLGILGLSNCRWKNSDETLFSDKPVLSELQPLQTTKTL